MLCFCSQQRASKAICFWSLPWEQTPNRTFNQQSFGNWNTERKYSSQSFKQKERQQGFQPAIETHAFTEDHTMIRRPGCGDWMASIWLNGCHPITSAWPFYQMPECSRRLAHNAAAPPSRSSTHNLPETLFTTFQKISGAWWIEFLEGLGPRVPGS